MARGYLSTILTAFWQIWFFPISSFQNKDFVNHFTTPLGFKLFHICSWSCHWPINYDGFSEYDFDIIIWREKLALISHRRRRAEKVASRSCSGSFYDTCCSCSSQPWIIFSHYLTNFNIIVYVMKKYLSIILWNWKVRCCKSNTFKFKSVM